MRLDRITIAEYDETWPTRFEEQRSRVEPLLSTWLAHPIEHIGSTSVPGLPAKPIIDMLAVVTRYEPVEAAFAALREISWVTAPEPGDEEARKWSLCHPTIEYRTHHLHIVEESTNWQHLLAFRDHLRASPEDRAEYARIKRELAAADDQDRPAYRSGKAPFITGILDRL